MYGGEPAYTRQGCCGLNVPRRSGMWYVMEIRCTQGRDVVVLVSTGCVMENWLHESGTLWS